MSDCRTDVKVAPSCTSSTEENEFLSVDNVTVARFMLMHKPVDLVDYCLSLCWIVKADVSFVVNGVPNAIVMRLHVSLDLVDDYWRRLTSRSVCETIAIVILAVWW